MYSMSDRGAEQSENKTKDDESDFYQAACDNEEVEAKVEEEAGEKGEEDKEEDKDSLGHSRDSGDYVDEAELCSWETGEEPLSETDLEQRRLEAAQYKLEGNSLYSDGKTREASGM